MRTKLVVTLIAIVAVAVPLYLASGISALAASAPISAGTGQGAMWFHAHRISSSDWAPCFAQNCGSGTGPGATMYFVIYNSTGAIVAHGFADESGTQVTGLAVGQTYSIYPADCDLCHNSTHNVVFDHWSDNSTSRPLAFVAQSSASLDAYYKIVELGANPPASTTNPATSESAPQVISVPPVGHTGGHKFDVSVIQKHNQETLTVVLQGDEVFEAPLHLKLNEHSVGDLPGADIQQEPSDQGQNMTITDGHAVRINEDAGGNEDYDNGND